jgi:hypothetical protein
MTTLIARPRTLEVSALVSRPCPIKTTVHPTSASRRSGFWMTLLRALAAAAA